MTDKHDTSESRRRLLKLVGGSALILPIASLTACSGGGDAEAPSSAASAPSPAEKPPASAAPPVAGDTAATAGGGDMSPLTENDALAQALGYVHEAADVDKTKYPRYESGQMCANCAQFLGGADEELGGCSIFPGRLVKRTGWCSVYVPKAV